MKLLNLPQVEHGADINQVHQHSYINKHTGPPLYLAINNQNVEMAAELLRLGATTVPRLQVGFDFLAGLLV